MFRKISQQELEELEQELEGAFQELFHNKIIGRSLALDTAMARGIIDKAKRHRQLRPKLNQLLDSLDESTRNRLKR